MSGERISGQLDASGRNRVTSGSSPVLESPDQQKDLVLQGTEAISHMPLAVLWYPAQLWPHGPQKARYTAATATQS